MNACKSARWISGEAVMSKQLLLTVALLATASMGQAFAQDKTKPDSIVLDSKVGSVLTSTGGDYQSAEKGKLLVEGESMMLNDGAEATVVYYYYYADGKRFRTCVEKYTGPETYVIDDNCKAAAWLTSNPRGTALIVGSAVVAAALLTGGNGDDGPPISAGAR